MKVLLQIFGLIFLLNCGNSTTSEDATPILDEVASPQVDTIIFPTGTTINTRFAPPSDFQRIKTKEGSFAHYLQHLPLKADGAKVHYYNGAVKQVEGVYCAVVDMDVGTRDLQQCADAIMRLRAEHLYAEQQFDKIHFNFTNGFRADYKRWRNGERISVKGNKVSWYAANANSSSYKSFRSYLTMVFSYAGTLSLEEELESVAVEQLQIGDVFIRGGSPGHAVIVVDVAVHPKTNKKSFLLAQSYMPAQEIQILQNPDDPNGDPWYYSDFGDVLNTPEWTFGSENLRRFQD